MTLTTKGTKNLSADDNIKPPNFFFNVFFSCPGSLLGTKLHESLHGVLKLNRHNFSVSLSLWFVVFGQPAVMMTCSLLLYPTTTLISLLTCSQPYNYMCAFNLAHFTVAIDFIKLHGKIVPCDCNFFAEFLKTSIDLTK